MVAADADLDVAAARIAFGKYLNCGQTCVAPDYVLADERIAGEFVEKLKAQIATMYGEDAFANPDWGRMVNAKHFDRVMGLIDPAKVAYGGHGQRRDAPDRAHRDVRCDGRRRRDGRGDLRSGAARPDLPHPRGGRGLHPKAREKPLALYLFTRDRALEERFLLHVPFGGGCVNDTIVHLATSRMGFGGVGASGIGSYHGRKSFETFSHEKSVLKKGLWLDLSMRYQPYSELKERLVRMFLR